MNNKKSSKIKEISLSSDASFVVQWDPKSGCLHISSSCVISIEKILRSSLPLHFIPFLKLVSCKKKIEGKTDEATASYVT